MSDGGLGEPVAARAAARLAGRVALVAGGARGLGAAQARLFVAAGAPVVVADRDTATGGALVEELARGGASALFVALDGTSEASWAAAVEATLARFGRLDVLANNVGVYHRADVLGTAPDDWDRVMAVNAKSAFLGTRAVIPAMRAGGGGSIVNLSSVSGLVGGRYSTAYNAAKGAVRLLTKSTAVQYAADRIRCNSVHPAPIETAMLADVFPGGRGREERLAEIPMGRFGDALEVAWAVLYLASDEAAYVTGAELAVDGGLTAR